MSTAVQSIKPQLKPRDLTMIVVGLVIGMGIFRTPAEVASRAEVPLIFFAAWITGAIVSAIGAITFAEIGSRLPVAGGFYRIFSVCYAPVFAFMVNWIIVISNAVSASAVAIMGAEYMAPLLCPSLPRESGIKLITISAIIILYAVNMLGIRVSSRTLNMLMIVKLALLVLVISVPFFVTGNSIENVHEVHSGSSNPFYAFMLCFIPVFFTYGGYQQTMNFGGDVQQPQKAVPRAIISGIIIILLIYIAVNISYVSVLGFEGLKNSTTLAADMIGALMGENAHKVVSILMFLSVMAFVNVSLISNPRVYYAMAEDKVMPEVFMRVNPKTQVQQFGVTFFCLIMIVVLFNLTSFQRLLGFVMFFDSISIIAAIGAIFLLRRGDKKETVSKDVFKMKGYPYLPLLFMIIYTGVTLAIMISDPQIFFTGVTMFVLGFPLFYLIQRIFK